LRLPIRGSLYAWEFEKGTRELRVRVEGQLTFNGTAQLLNAALAGCGLAYVPEGLVEAQVAKGRLRRVLADWCPPYSGYHLFYPSRRFRAFIAQLCRRSVASFHGRIASAACSMAVIRIEPAGFSRKSVMARAYRLKPAFGGLRWRGPGEEPQSSQA
jgi:hypothetical protein